MKIKERSTKMNWLAHLFLSESKIDQQLGNILADPLKGKTWNGASADMVFGMQLHQRIDVYTDSHEAVFRSKARLGEGGRLKAVVIDLVYDHFLTKNWNLFVTVPLADFLQTFYERAKERSVHLPHRAGSLVVNLVGQDRLNQYHDLEQLKAAFERVDRRLSQRLLARESVSSYFDEVLRHIDALENDFFDFFPDLCRHIENCFDHKKPDHWRI